MSGYHVYRQDSATAPFVRLTTTPVTGTSYTDATASSSGAYTYMVRAVRLETTGGGTFYNASLGVQQAINLATGPAALQIATAAALPPIDWNTAYATTLSAQGGTPVYTWSVVAGSLPPGLALSPGGAFTGVATTSGVYSFTAQVNDAAGQMAQQAFTVNVQSNNLVTLLPVESTYVYSSAPTRAQGPTETMTRRQRVHRLRLFPALQSGRAEHQQLLRLGNPPALRRRGDDGQFHRAAAGEPVRGRPRRGVDVPAP